MILWQWDFRNGVSFLIIYALLMSQAQINLSDLISPSKT